MSSETKSRIKKNALVAFGVILSIWISLPFFLSGWVQSQLEERLELEIEGKRQPLLFQSAFRMKDPHFVWKEKVEVQSGELTVHYSLGALLKGNLLDLKMKGKNLGVRLLGSWSEIQNVEEAVVEDLKAHLAFSTEGLEDVHYVHVSSPDFQFHITKNEV